VLQLEKTLKENKDKLESQEVSELEAAIEKAKSALKEHEKNADELQKAYDELIQASHKVAEKLYKAQPGAEQHDQTSSAGNQSASDEPIDADIEE
jgi:molecular chaperone DnaK